MISSHIVSQVTHQAGEVGGWDCGGGGSALMVSELAYGWSGPGSCHCVCFKSWEGTLLSHCLSPPSVYKFVQVDLMPIGNPVID